MTTTTRRSFFARLAALLVAPKVLSARTRINGAVAPVELSDSGLLMEGLGHYGCIPPGSMVLVDDPWISVNTRFDDHSAHIARFIEDGGHLL